MAADDHDLQGLRDLFASEIKRIDAILTEREKQSVYALDAAEQAIQKTDTESQRARDAANRWREAIAEREKSYVLQQQHDLLQDEVDHIRRSADAANGRRAAWVAAAGVIATLLALGIGQVLRSNLTAADVSQQIQREAPWNNDKAEVERRISILERENEATKIQINKLQQQLLLSTRR